jgi:hypothetical protein
MTADPGPASADLAAGVFTLSNNWLSAKWKFDGGAVSGLALADKLNHQTIPLPTLLFSLHFQDGKQLDSSAFRLSSAPRSVMLQGNTDSSRLGDRFDGRAFLLEMDNADNSLHVTWRVILRDGAAYLRQELTLESRAKPLQPLEITLFDWTLPGTTPSENLPVVAGNLFYAIESPFAHCASTAAGGQCSYARSMPLDKGQSVALSGVAGIAAPGQMRRAFQRYVQRERVHPYRQFLEWNSRFDLGLASHYDEKSTLASIHGVGDLLITKYLNPVNAFTLWDGWDDPSNLWHLNAGFPKGIGAVKDATVKLGSATGIWFSPRGGSGARLKLRLATAKKPGLEIADGGFALAGTRYFTLLRDAALKAQKENGAVLYAFDSLGSDAPSVSGSFFDSDFAASASLLSELRTNNSELFVVLTRPLPPSPFWLWQADAIASDAEGQGFLGEGTPRQRWITYRDAKTYDAFVRSGSWFPSHAASTAVLLSPAIKGLDTPAGTDFRDEVRTLFASGQSLQELDITPSLMGDAEWQAIAQAANWARANSDLLADAHWLGGDPAKGELYGWTAWRPGMGLVVLRNPSSQPRSFPLDVAQSFELPQGAAKSYTLKPVFPDAPVAPLTAKAGTPLTLTLRPYEVVVLEAFPAGK